MSKHSPQERAARKRAERKKRRRSGGGGESDQGGGGGLMSGLRGGFKGAVHGQPSTGRRAIGWLPILLVIVALLVLIRRLGIF